MNIPSGNIALAIVLSFGVATVAYAVDRVGSPQKSETTDSPAATGLDPGAQKAPPPTTGGKIRGELLKIDTATDGSFYTVKDSTGKEVRLHVNKETKMDGSFKVGDRIEAESNASGHAMRISRASDAGGTQSTPSKMDTGAPGTPGGSGLGTDTGTEKESKPPTR
jgi:hypothetical protein